MAVCLQPPAFACAKIAAAGRLPAPWRPDPLIEQALPFILVVKTYNTLLDSEIAKALG